MAYTRAALARRFLIVTSWTVATALAATIAWGAVSRLDEGSSNAPSTLSQTDVRIELAQSPRSAATPPSVVNPEPTTSGHTPSSANPSRKRQHPKPRQGGSSTSPQPPTTTSKTPTQGGSSPPGTPDPSAPGSTPPSRGTPEPKRTSKSWQLTGGSVGVSCKGPDISLPYATPRDGWEMHIEKSGPASVEVSFSREDHESRLTARCDGGNPVGQTQESGDNGGGAHE